MYFLGKCCMKIIQLFNIEHFFAYTKKKNNRFEMKLMDNAKYRYDKLQVTTKTDHV